MRNKRSRGIDPSVSSSKYTGPMRLPATAGANTTMTTMLSSVTSLSHNNIGEVFVYYTTVDATNTAEWSTWQTLYQEYRVLGIEVEYLPIYGPGYESTSIIPASGGVAITHEDGSSGPPTITQLVENNTYKPWNTGRRIKHTWKMDGLGESNFFPTNTNSNFGGVAFAAGGGTPLDTVGRLYVRYMIQFKGRK